MTDNRRIRVFVSSTFRDMMAEREELMTHAWPELRRFCRERQVELVEVDLRWGIAEEQSTRQETLKLCLDEIHACRPFFIGLLGERYGWVPGDDAFTADLAEEQPWLKDLHGKSVTELEILHGVLNNPEMAGRVVLLLPRSGVAQGARRRLPLGNAAADDVQTTRSRQRSAPPAPRRASRCTKTTRTRSHWPLSSLTISRPPSKPSIPSRMFPMRSTREAQDHEAFAEIRRRTYIGRADYFAELDRHAMGDGGPLVLLGDPGAANPRCWPTGSTAGAQDHPAGLHLQHYIGGTPDSADHWRLMTRLIV